MPNTNKTALERAFDLARSGGCISVAALIKRLDREGELPRVCRRPFRLSHAAMA
jgi:hypothetical protein